MNNSELSTGYYGIEYEAQVSRYRGVIGALSLLVVDDQKADALQARFDSWLERRRTARAAKREARLVRREARRAERRLGECSLSELFTTAHNEYAISEMIQTTSANEPFAVGIEPEQDLRIRFQTAVYGKPIAPAEAFEPRPVAALVELTSINPILDTTRHPFRKPEYVGVHRQPDDFDLAA